MRKHDVRKWLHAVLDLLPVILIPVFMIYSHRHTINDGSIQVQEKIAVNVTQQYLKDGSQSDTRVGDVSVTFSSTDITIDGVVTDVTNTNQNTIISYSSNNKYLVANHKYLLRCLSMPSGIRLQQNYYGSNGMQAGASVNVDTNSFIFTNYVQANLQTYVVFNLNLINLDDTFDDVVIYPEIYDLTSMNLENISVSDFNSMFPSYISFDIDSRVLIDGDLVTYNDTDIMSQMTYQLYNSVDKYFNMGNVFNLNGVYDWFNLNIFNGQAPIYIFIVWQIVLYEFVMDLMFLLYGLFMWFIDMVEKLMEKPINSVR